MKAKIPLLPFLWKEEKWEAYTGSATSTYIGHIEILTVKVFCNIAWTKK